MPSEPSPADLPAGRTREQDTVAVNEALVLGSLRQHELREAAERLNAQLQVEIATRQILDRKLGEKARLLDLSNDAIIVRDLEDRITLWNKGAERLYGWTAEEVMGRDLHSVLETEFPKPKEEIVAQLYRDGHFAGEVVQRARGGRRIASLCRWVLDQDTESILTSYTDTTERRAAAEALQASEARFRAAIGAVSSLIWTSNAFGQVEGEQPGWASFTGQTQEEYQGDGWIRAVHPEDAQPTLAAWASAVAEKRPFEFEHRLRRQDGEWRLCSIRAVPVFSGAGAVQEWVGVHTDITERRHSENVVRESEEHLRAFITASSDVIYQMNADWSEMGQLDGRNFVQDAANPSRTWLEDNIFPEDHAPVLAAIHEAIRNKGIFALEHRVRRVDGTPGWTFSKAVPILNPQGEIVEWFGTASDITERRQAEEALRTSEEFKRSIIESSNDCIKVLDHEGRLLSLEAGQELLGIQDLAPYLGTSWIDFWVREEDRAAARAAISAALRGEEGRFVGFFRTLHGDDKWWDVIITQIRDPSGRPPRLLVVSRDVTERRQADEAQRASEERYRGLFNGIDEGFCVVEMIYDSDGRPVDYRFLETNPSFERQSGLVNAQGKTIREFAPDHEDGWFEAYGHVAATGELMRFQQRGAALGRWFDLVAFRCGTPEQRQVAVLFTDITERRQMEEALVARAEALARADRSKDEFLAMLAHELRNPLAPLRNAAELLKGDDLRPDERREAEEIVSRQIENMSRMIDDLLDISRITEGKIELRKKAIPLRPILAAAARAARSACDARQQELAVSLPAEPLLVDADATRLEQVFGNLLHNASKYSGEGSHIALEAERAGDEVIVTVRDDGAGIDPELLPHIFEPFVQASRTLDRTHGGLGIGLTLVGRLVKLHGGCVEARSEGLGHGAEFVVRLPILSAASMPAPEASLPLRRSQPQSRRILIVDDNVDSAESMASLQTRRGHVTRTAFNGPDAITAAAEFQPQAVLLDIGLPGMDGYQVARHLRDMPGLSGLLLIAMTGYASPEDRRAAKDAGFDEHLPKPVDLETLRELLIRGSTRLVRQPPGLEAHHARGVLASPGGRFSARTPAMAPDDLQRLRSAIRDVQDFPKPGIVFKDITPILADPTVFRIAIDAFVEATRELNVNKVVGIDARGFLFGAAVAYELGLGFIPVRKKGKLPYRCESAEYRLEYGEAVVEMHVDALTKGERVVLIDDLLATGGTAAAAVKLIEKMGGELAEAQFLIELGFLNGRENLNGTPTRSFLEFK
jgi:adenine phosphoribosyltransferase